MDTWQPNTVLYPDAELVLCAGVRALHLCGYVGRTVPKTLAGSAIVVNRVGGRDPVALIQFRCFAPTDQAATDLARTLAARLPSLLRFRIGVVGVTQNEGPTDLGRDTGTPMRQLMYEVRFAGRDINQPQLKELNHGSKRR